MWVFDGETWTEDVLRPDEETEPIRDEGWQPELQVVEQTGRSSLVRDLPWLGPVGTRAAR